MVQAAEVVLTENTILCRVSVCADHVHMGGICMKTVMCHIVWIAEQTTKHRCQPYVWQKEYDKSLLQSKTF